MRKKESFFISKTFIKYFIAGLLAALTHLIVFQVLLTFFFVHYLLASTLGFIAAIAVNYPLQYFWTFNAASTHAQAFSKYLLVTLAMLLLNLLVLSSLLSWNFMPPLFAQLVAIGVVFIANFSINSLFTFR